MKKIWASDSYGLNTEPEDRVFESEEILLFELSTDVSYYGYYPNEWHESYKAQLYEFFKKEKGNWYILLSMIYRRFYLSTQQSVQDGYCLEKGTYQIIELSNLSKLSGWFKTDKNISFFDKITINSI